MNRKRGRKEEEEHREVLDGVVVARMYRPKCAGVERRQPTDAWPAFALEKPCGLKNPRKHVETSFPRKTRSVAMRPKKKLQTGVRTFQVPRVARCHPLRCRASLCGMRGLQAPLKLDVWPPVCVAKCLKNQATECRTTTVELGAPSRSRPFDMHTACGKESHVDPDVALKLWCAWSGPV